MYKYAIHLELFAYLFIINYILSMNSKFISFFSSFGLLLCAAIWGFAFVVVKDSLEFIGAFYMVAVRYTLAAIVMALIIAKRWKKINKNYLLHGVISGFFLGMGYITQTIGCDFTTAGKNAFLTTIYVILIPFIAWLLYKKRPEWYVFVAAVMSVTGIGLLALGTGDTTGLNKGDIFTLICGVFYALHIVWTEKYNKQGDDTLLLTNIQFFVAAALSWILAPIYDGKQDMSVLLNSRVLVSMLYLGLFSTMLCFTLQNMGLKYVKSSLASLFLSFESVFGVLFSCIILHEVLTLRMFFGCVLIFLAIVLAETKFQFFGKKEK